MWIHFAWCCKLVTPDALAMRNESTNSWRPSDTLMVPGWPAPDRYGGSAGTTDGAFTLRGMPCQQILLYNVSPPPARQAALLPSSLLHENVPASNSKHFAAKAILARALHGLS